jgi:hypothetical protein
MVMVGAYPSDEVGGGIDHKSYEKVEDDGCEREEKGWGIVSRELDADAFDLAGNEASLGKQDSEDANAKETAALFPSNVLKRVA